MASTSEFPSPPSYEEAIGRPLLNTPSAPPLTTSYSSTGLTPQDFGNSGLFQEDSDDRDIEEERDYEESRPLKMGQIPDARAQYTFIQPNDTINNGSNSSRYNPFERFYPHKPSNQSNRPIQQHQQYSPSRHPKFNAPSAPPQESDECHHHHHHHHHHHQQQQQQQQQQQHHHQQQQQQQQQHQQKQWGQEDQQSNLDISEGSPAQSASTGGSTSYVPPPFPPPPMAPAAVPVAGIPNTPGLINAQDISIADFKRTKKCVESCDKVLQDPYQLYRYFVAHNDRPTMHMLIRGHHMERKEVMETDSDGKSRAVTKTWYVEDFKMDFDLTPYISPRGALFTAPDPKTGKTLTIRGAMEKFADEENQFKEMHMHKNVVWDYEELQKAITHAIRSVNYRHTIDISFPCTNNVVIVNPSSPLANFMRNGWTKALCCISLVGCIFYPAREIYKKVDKSLKSEFQMTISTRDFYMENYWNIVDQVQYK